MLTPSISEELSPIARCLLIAAARGRALRLARERAAAEQQPQPSQSDQTPLNTASPGEVQP